MVEERDETPPIEPGDEGDEGAWDLGLAAVYGDDDETLSSDDDADSILATLESRLGTSSRILLPDDAAGSGPPSVFTREGIETGRRVGKYMILGEIARGGMGVILRGRDIDLGRDVAMKVLKGEHADKGSMVQRFVEEAQIGGQLQHPGIVPVYEMGLDAGMRPYFAMKLVNGRTFSALLNERSDPSTERGRHLQIFEQVCQTIAYAHSRNVIHRDVKPSNVMVGAFGEVQVFDWGFAKVLTRGGIDDERAAMEASAVPEPSPDIATVRSGDAPGSQSIAGSVLGTPSYMPPEQACGNVAALDERADVFALGAILCEILTGQPPYVRQPGSDVMEQARDASLDDALQRLRDCDAEAELVSLARSCLQEEINDRPRDASVVANAISDYLSHSEERTQAAQVSAAEARVRAVEERKARKLTAALAVAVVVLICVAVGITWSKENDRVEADRAMHAALSDAGDLSRAGSWSAAREALRRAELLVDAERGSPELHASVRRFRARFDRDFETARLRKADDDLIAALRRIYTRPETGSSTFENHAYAAALREYGIDLTDLPPEEAARQIREKGRLVAVEIAFALDDWSGKRRDTRALWDPKTRSTLSTLRTIVELIDDDRWRQQLRDADRKRDRPTLRSIAVDLKPDDHDPRSIGRLAMILRRHGLADEALALLRKSFHAHIDDFWINYSLVRALVPSNRSAWERRGQAIDDDTVAEAVTHMWIALARQPTNAYLRYRLANLLQLQGNGDEALIHMTEAVALDSESTTIRLGLANLLILQGELQWAREQLARAFDIPVDSYVVRRHIQNRLDKLDIRSGAPLQEIIENLREELDGDRDQRELHRQLAIALYRTADWSGAAAEAEATLALDAGDLDMRLLLARLRNRQGRFGDALEILDQNEKRGDDEPDLVALRAAATAFVSIAGDIDESVRQKPGATGQAARELAEFLLRRGSFAQAARFFVAAWGDRPPSVFGSRGRAPRGRSTRSPILRGAPSTLRDAISAAARAGCGMGSGADALDATKRTALRARAMSDLQRVAAEFERFIDGRSRRLARGLPVFSTLEGWLNDVRLACIRDPGALANLPPAEAAEWSKLWKRLEDLLTRVAR